MSLLIIVRTWLEERCRENRGASTPVAELHADFRHSCRIHGEQSAPLDEFAEALRYSGVALVDAEDAVGMPVRAAADLELVPWGAVHRLIIRWFRTRCRREEGAHTRWPDLFRDYQPWIVELGAVPFTYRRFCAHLINAGVRDVEIDWYKRAALGVVLLHPPAQQAPKIVERDADRDLPSGINEWARDRIRRRRGAVITTAALHADHSGWARGRAYPFNMQDIARFFIRGGVPRKRFSDGRRGFRDITLAARQVGDMSQEERIDHWIRECCEIDPQSFTSSKEVETSWRAWAQEKKIFVSSKALVCRRLALRGFEQHRNGKARVRGFLGFRLIDVHLRNAEPTGARGVGSVVETSAVANDVVLTDGGR